MTAQEAAARLGQDSGIPISLDVPRFPAGAQVPALYQRLNDRHSFDWKQTTFAVALRQLCQRYSLQPVRRWGAYSLHAVSGASRATRPSREVQVEKAGMVFYVRKITSRDNRVRDLTGQGGTLPEQTLWVDLGLDLGKRDSDEIAGLDNVVARDDRGQILITDRPAGRLPSLSTPADTPYPDEWTGSVYLSLPHALAERLAWLEADVVGYESVKSHRMEIPLPAKPESSKASVAGMSVELVEFRSGGDSTAPHVRVRVYMPSQAGGVSGDAMPYPSLVGESGRLYPPTRPSAQGGSSGAGIAYTLDCDYPPIGEPVQKAVFRIVERGKPTRLARVRVEGVPLPDYRPLMPRRSNVPLPLPPDHRPLYDRAGAALSFPVFIEGEALTDGFLTLGLTPKNTPEPSIHWLDATIGSDGMVRLDSLKPGTYRVLRVFQPRMDRVLPNKGRWLNAEVEAVLTSGKEARLPTLRWTPESAAAGAPALGPRPAPKPAKKPAPKAGTKPAPRKPRK